MTKMGILFFKYDSIIICIFFINNMLLVIKFKIHLFIYLYLMLIDYVNMSVIKLKGNYLSKLTININTFKK